MTMAELTIADELLPHAVHALEREGIVFEVRAQSEGDGPPFQHRIFIDGDDVDRARAILAPILREEQAPVLRGAAVVLLVGLVAAIIFAFASALHRNAGLPAAAVVLLVALAGWRWRVARATSSAFDRRIGVRR